MVWSDSGDTSDFSEYSAIALDSQIPRKKDVKKYACTYDGCQLVFSRPFRLTAHIFTHTGEKPFQCNWSGCTKAYTNKSHLSRHVRSAHEHFTNSKSYKCNKCEEVFKTTQNLKKHTVRLHEYKYPYYCSVCQTGYKKKNVLAQHMYYHTGIHPFKCNLCEKTFFELIEFNKHKRNHKMFECFCKQVFTRWSDMVKHRKLAHILTEYTCDFCHKTFKSRFEIVKHIKSHSTNKLVYPCTYNDCPKFYSSKYNLSFHIQSFHENLTYNCTVEGCNAKLSTKAKLQFHMSKHNNSNKILSPKKPRQKIRRKDVGSHKRSTAAKLLGLKLTAKEEKAILEKQSRLSNVCNIIDGDLGKISSESLTIPKLLNKQFW